MRSESFPCLVCGKSLLRVIDENEAQPSDGVMCSTTGNYGSTAFDSLTGEVIRFNICDDCFLLAGDQGRLQVSVERVPVLAELDGLGYSVIGWHMVERPFVNWAAELEPFVEREHMDAVEVMEHLDDRNYHWTLPRDILLSALITLSED